MIGVYSFVQVEFRNYRSTKYVVEELRLIDS